MTHFEIQENSPISLPNTTDKSFRPDAKPQISIFEMSPKLLIHPKFNHVFLNLMATQSLLIIGNKDKTKYSFTAVFLYSNIEYVQYEWLHYHI